MSLLTGDGMPKLVPTCSYPLTGLRCVDRVYTDQAIILIGNAGVAIRETYGITAAELRARLGL